MDQLAHFLAALGPPAILAGAAFEGQTAVIAGGVLARQGMLSPFVAVAAAAMGSGVLDQVLFILGRSFRDSRFVQRVSAKVAFAKALNMIERHPTLFILSFRFLYGLRAAGPVAVGVTHISTTRFAVLNALGAVIWAAAFVGLGYAFGPAVMLVFNGLMAHAAPIAIGAGLVAVIAGLIIWRWRVWAAERVSPDAAEG
ncbi:DedA family protein [Phenylobacterium sp.]|uniref:DedA family protein n=1 Tax=Phenylobacterium sp. TaxID=1871053 RepID=UPI0025F869DE|nr:DedA family protein [Phenylobacterium sp.]